MKNFLFKKLRKILTQTTKIVLAANLVTSCVAIPGNNVKIEKYPEVDQKVIDNIDLSYRYTNKPDWIKKYNPQKYPDPYVNQVDDSYILAERVSGKLDSSFRSTKDYSKTFKKCDVSVTTKVYWPMPMTCFFHQYLSAFTLTIIPYYCQTIYKAKATLISYPTEDFLKGKEININPNQVNLTSNKIEITHTKKEGYFITEDKKKIKEGEYFIDENNRLAKLLKTYDLEDKVHEVWSVLWMLSWFVVNPNKYVTGAEYPKDIKKVMQNNISEAFSRQILNDAKTFPECQKK